MSLPTCPQCSDTSHPPPTGIHQRNDTGAAKAPYYDTGVICCVHETTATAIEWILLGSPGIQDDTTLRQQCQEELDRIYTCAKHPYRKKGKKRPCILMNPAPVSSPSAAHANQAETQELTI
ncbi:hypothetical protein ONZ51_g10810 [Trametes cubensis]|uniref:Uncharacterized protein n=1 Tax=Trametes cubensis TaxID=1111947 RepID=A0AAD7X8H5_9APHY|nr:hypothetical protein ONZ51_g10810 [Trametes cubensis]